jgi:transcriptional regulator with XRE-family HTH domain
MTQRQFGRALGWSMRTASRWDTGRSTPSVATLAKLATLLAPIDRALAEEAASRAGVPLSELAQDERQAGEGHAPAATKAVTRAEAVDLVVFAAAEAADASPRTQRRAVYVAAKRARELGLTLEALEEALAPGAAKE